MGTRHQSQGSRKRTRYKWQWAEEFASQSRTIPDSWARNGAVEEAADGEEQFYAVKVRPGLFLEYEVTDGGNIVSGPHRERQGMLVGYTNHTCDSIVIRRIITERNRAGTLKPPDDFTAIITPEGREKMEYDGLGDEVESVISNHYSEVRNND